MPKRRPARPRVNIQLIAAVAALGYFGFHFVHGDRGAVALLEARAELAAAQGALKTAEHVRDSLDSRVALLRPESLDADMLAEQARRQLNFAGAREFVLETPRALTARLAQ